MIRIDITKHAYCRMKQRLGWGKKTAQRMAEVAYMRGVGHGETNGHLHKYISSQLLGYMKKGHCIKIYGETVFCFVKEKGEEDVVTLITVWAVPHSLKEHALRSQRNKTSA